MDLISKKTRSEFQEFLVSKTLREIELYFDNHDVVRVTIPPNELPSGQRRSLVAEYYSSINWAKYSDVKTVLKVYEDILNDLNKDIFSNESWKNNCIDKLTKYLLKDGYKFEEGKLFKIGLNTDFEEIKNATSTLDKSHFNEYIDRIKKSIDEDPATAIGSTKELVESTLKTILSEMNVAFEKDEDVPKLLKKVQKALDIVPDEIDDSKKGAEAIKILLSNLGQIVIKISELRNLYGTGHGKENRRKGLNERHARLIVGSGITLCTFLLETFDLKKNN